MRGEGNSGWAGYQARAAGARLAKEKKEAEERGSSASGLLRC